MCRLRKFSRNSHGIVDHNVSIASWLIILNPVAGIDYKIQCNFIEYVDSMDPLDPAGSSREICRSLQSARASECSRIQQDPIDPLNQPK